MTLNLIPDSNEINSWHPFDMRQSLCTFLTFFSLQFLCDFAYISHFISNVDKVVKSKQQRFFKIVRKKELFLLMWFVLIPTTATAYSVGRRYPIKIICSVLLLLMCKMNCAEPREKLLDQQTNSRYLSDKHKNFIRMESKIKIKYWCEYYSSEIIIHWNWLITFNIIVSYR